MYQNRINYFSAADSSPYTIRRPRHMIGCRLSKSRHPTLPLKHSIGVVSTALSLGTERAFLALLFREGCQTGLLSEDAATDKS